MTLKNTIKSKSGFSLTEILTVVAIIAVVALIVVPIVLGVTNKSKDKDDEVLAATYSEYMQKFANEKAGDISYYPTLDNGDYIILQNSSGNGAFPGMSHLSSDMNTSADQVWDAIRKEACIAISAYSGKPLADTNKYFIEKPNNDKMAFVYYYLTGTVALKPIEEMENNKATLDQAEDGAVDPNDFWVYLDREGGSGKLPSPNSRDFWIKVVNEMGTNVVNADVSIIPHEDEKGEIKKATTAESGTVIFRNVTYSRFETHAEADGAYTWWTEEHYPDSNPNVNLEVTPNIGTPANPYIIVLKVGSKGGLEMYETIKTNKAANSDNSPNWYTSHALIKGDNEMNIDFSPAPHYNNMLKPSNYIVVCSKHNGFDFNQIVDCPDCKGHLLQLGDFTMDIADKSNVFLPYSQKIKSDVRGIYDADLPEEKYVNATSPYRYPVYLKRNSTLVTGTIAEEVEDQPLFASNVSILGNSYYVDYTSGASEESELVTVDINSYVLLVSKTNSSVQYRGDLVFTNNFVPGEANETKIYSFSVELEGKHAGEEFNMYLVTEVTDSGNYIGSYGDYDTHRMTIAKWPSPITADGCTYKLEAESTEFVRVNLQSDVQTHDFSVYCFEDLQDTFDKGVECDVTLTRLGYPGKTGEPFVYTAHAIAGFGEGKANFTDVKKGFYHMQIRFHEKYNEPVRDYTIFVGTGDYVIRLVPEPGVFTPTFKVIPLTKDGNEITARTEYGNILKEAFDKNGKKLWDSIECRVCVDVPLDKAPIANASVTISFDSKNNRAYLVYDPTKSGTIIHNIRIIPDVDCFTGEYVWTADSGTDLQDNEEIFITRIESEDSSDNHSQFWDTVADASTHSKQCLRCAYKTFTYAHFTDVNGVADSHATYFTNIFDANDTKIFAGKTHIKHCSYCNLYDEVRSHTEEANWTPYYNRYIATSQKHGDANSHGEGAFVSGTPNKVDAIAKSDAYHYKYCTVCFARLQCEKHNASHEHNKMTGHSECPSGKYTYKFIDKDYHQYVCDACGYSKDKTAHTYGETEKQSVSGGYVYYNTCTGCGHREVNTVVEHEHVFSADCGEIHYDKWWNGESGCNSHGVWHDTHCWGCKAEVNDDGSITHNAGCPVPTKGTPFSCLVCEICGITQYSAIPYTTTKDSNGKVVSSSWARWCGTHHTLTRTVADWKTKVDGVPNQHHTRVFQYDYEEGKYAYEVKKP